MTPQLRYEHDPSFKALVDLIHKWIIDCQYTPTEVREAAMLAAIHHSSYTLRHPFLFKNEGELG